MNPLYNDIEDRLGWPDFWDQHGCPRYATFSPKLVTVYAKVASLIEIACQDCGERFAVGQPGPTAFELTTNNTYNNNYQVLSDVEFERAVGRFPVEYGDAPSHGGCVGETMTTDLIRAIELWSREEGDWQLVPWHRWPKELQ